MRQRKPEKSERKKASQIALNTYLILNATFLCVILLIIIYSLIFREAHPIPAALTEFTGLVPPSKGLSAAFSQIVRLDLQQAYDINTHSLRVFAFFLLQLIIRGGLIFFIRVKPTKVSMRVIYADVVVSVVLFVICLYPLIAYTFRVFSELLH